MFWETINVESVNPTEIHKLVYVSDRAICILLRVVHIGDPSVNKLVTIPYHVCGWHEIANNWNDIQCIMENARIHTNIQEMGFNVDKFIFQFCHVCMLRVLVLTLTQTFFNFNFVTCVWVIGLVLNCQTNKFQFNFTSRSEF